MAVSPRVVKGRIKSIKSTRKITKALELVSAAKMKKAVDRALQSREYARESYEVLKRIIAKGKARALHPLLQERVSHNILMILVSSDRGMVGGLHANLAQYVAKITKDPRSLAMSRTGNVWKTVDENEKVTLDIATIGKKSEMIASKLSLPVVASFNELSDVVSLDEVRAVTKFVIDQFLTKKYDKVLVVYSDFISVINQKPKVRQLLPVSIVDLEKTIASALNEAPMMSRDEQRTLPPNTEKEKGDDYIFEPGVKEILEEMVPKIVLTQMYQALLESRSSEHSARMMAMKNASDNAKEIIEDLQTMYNQLRQAKITQEIAEISAGKAALE